MVAFQIKLIRVKITEKLFYIIAEPFSCPVYLLLSQQSESQDQLQRSTSRNILT